MGMAGEISYKAQADRGTGSFHIGIIDAVSRMDGETVKAWAKLHEVER